MSVIGSHMNKVPLSLSGSAGKMDVNAVRDSYVPSVSMPDNPLFGILNPESICIMGASNKINSMGTTALLNITGSGFTGPVYVVHPRDRSVQDVKTFSRMEDLPEVAEVDAILVYGLGVYATDLWKRVGTRAKGELPSEMVQALKGMLEAQADTMSETLKAGGKPVLAANLDASMDKGVRRMMVKGNIPVYNGPEKAVKALEAMWRCRKMRDSISI